MGAVFSSHDKLYASFILYILTLEKNDVLSGQRHTSFKFCTIEVTVWGVSFTLFFLKLTEQA